MYSNKAAFRRRTRRRAVTATLETLRQSLMDGGIDTLPPEIRRLLPAKMASATPDRPQSVAGAHDTSNPQVIGEVRSESGGESTADNGQ